MPSPTVEPSLPAVPVAEDTQAQLTAWQPDHVAQRALAQSYLAYLTARPDAWSRECAPGHFTASTMVFSADLSQVALVLHGIMGIWVQPGGHLEPDDADLQAAARREVREELGLEVTLDPDIATLDCHVVQCRGYTHPTRHLDVRFVGRAAPEADLHCSDESHDVRWWSIDALPDDLHPDIAALVDAGLHRLRRGE